MDAAAVIARRRRRRGLLLGLIALACGALAAAGVRDTVESVESRTGSPVPVVVAATELPEGERLQSRTVREALTLREVPARYAPRDALAAPDQAVGLELAVPLATGAYVTTAMLRIPGDEAQAVAAVPPGHRLVQVVVSGARELAGSGGGRVDVLVTTEGRAGGGRTFVALEDVELVSVRPLRGGEVPDATGASPDAEATLRVGARAAVFLTAAQNFAREVRLLARPTGDRGRVGRSSCALGAPRSRLGCPAAPGPLRSGTGRARPPRG